MFTMPATKLQMMCAMPCYTMMCNMFFGIHLQRGEATSVKSSYLF